MAHRIGVGIIGVTPAENPANAGWANVAHIPALRALPEYDIRAVCSRTRASAEATARALGVPSVFDDPHELAACPDVDVVAVTVRVPGHLPLVEAAIGAGKRVYCEWPLGNGLAEAERMAAMARARNLHCAVGVQARVAPAIRYVRDLIAQGYVGEVLSTSLIGSGMNWGPGMVRRNLYTLDKSNGATLLSIPAGHALDALCHCLGPFTEVSATSALRRRQIRLPGDPQDHPATAEDQWAISGVLASGAVVSVHYRGGFVRGSNLLWEINGTEGDLRLTSDSGHLQILQPRLQGARGNAMLADLAVPAPYRLVDKLGDPALNVAQMYALYAGDIRNGTRECPGFDDAVGTHRLLVAIEDAAKTGCRQRVPGPTTGG
jgi:predicted dehydrogenase